MKTQLAENRKDLEALTKAVDQLGLLQLRDRVTAVETVSTDLKKGKEESEKRHWQFVYIAAGAGFALLSSFLVQLVFYFLKK